MSFTRKTGLLELRNFSQDKLALLNYRTSLQLSGSDNICLHHEKYFIEKFCERQRKCCDPFDRHRTPVKSGLRIINERMANILITLTGKNIIPGWKLCPRCISSVTCPEDGNKVHEFHEAEESDHEDYMETAFDAVDSSLSAVGCSPLKMQKLNKSQKLQYCKRHTQALTYTVGHILEEDNEPLNLSTEYESAECIKCIDYDKLITNLAKKMQNINKS